MGETSIEWTDKTWNPVTGCTKVSAGCKNCYAERVFPRVYGKSLALDHPTGLVRLSRPRKFTDVECHEDRLEQPLHWRWPSRIFVNSMADLFHEDVPIDFIDRVLEVIAACPQHQFQVLTKRAHLLHEKLYGITKTHPCRELGGGDYLPNLWLGVSVEDQKTADERIPLLLQTPAAVRFVSYEPALAAVDFCRSFGCSCGHLSHWNLRSFEQTAARNDMVCDFHDRHRKPRLDWVIIGGESGPGARPFDINWARDVIAQCRTAGVACFVKQLGSAPYTGRNGSKDLHRLNDRKGGDMAEWPADLRIREFPKAEVLA